MKALPKSGSFARAAMVALGLVGALALSPGMASAQLRSTGHPRVCWTDFDTADPRTGRLRVRAPRPLPDGDRIMVRRNYTAPPGLVVFHFSSATEWWKGLLVETRGSDGVLETHRLEMVDGFYTIPDQQGVSTNVLPALVLRASEVERVVFRKAKFLGIHTDMYELASKPGCTIGSLAGQTIQFSWLQD